jgi:hypothetical protein
VFHNPGRGFAQRVGRSPELDLADTLRRFSVSAHGWSVLAGAGGVTLAGPPLPAGWWARLTDQDPADHTRYSWVEVFPTGTGYLDADDSMAGVYNAQGAQLRTDLAFGATDGPVVWMTPAPHNQGEWHTFEDRQAGAGVTPDVDPGVCELRLTPVSGNPVYLSPSTGFTAVYLTPYRGNRVSLYGGPPWANWSPPEMAIGLTGMTAGKNYDLFLYSDSAVPSSTDTATDVLTFAAGDDWQTGSWVRADQTGGGLTVGTNYFYRRLTSTTGTLHPTVGDALAGTGKINLTAAITATLTALSLELSAAWTNDTTRANALARQDGVLVKSADHRRRYLGMLRATGTTTYDHSFQKRFLANYYHQVPLYLSNGPAAVSWNYTTASWRLANNDTSFKVEFVLCEDGPAFDVHSLVTSSNTLGELRTSGIGIDTTTAPATRVTAGGTARVQHFLRYPSAANVNNSAGYHYAAMLEYGVANGVTTWYSQGPDANYEAGVAGWVMG